MNHINVNEYIYNQNEHILILYIKLFI